MDKVFTKDNSFIRKEAERWVANANGTKTRIYEAIVFGDDKTQLSPAQLQEMWRSQPRIISKKFGERKAEALMLANAERESSRFPFIFRYESGRHKLDPSWKVYDEFEATSGGLFQLMGFNYKKYGIKDWKDIASAEKQLDVVDKFLSYCHGLAFRVQDHPTAHKDIAYRAIAAFGQTSLYGARQQTTLTNIKYEMFSKIYLYTDSFYRNQEFLPLPRYS